MNEYQELLKKAKELADKYYSELLVSDTSFVEKMRLMETYYPGYLGRRSYDLIGTEIMDKILGYEAVKYETVRYEDFVGADQVSFRELEKVAEKFFLAKVNSFVFDW